MKPSKIFSAIALLSVVCFSVLNAQVDKPLVANFTSNDWKAVKQAKYDIEDLQGAVLPDMIALLNNSKMVKLTNTGSLIYPGAAKFFGHGQILDYDIDRINVRAGWLIEEVSFNNFGFSGVHLPDDVVEGYIKITFPDYYNNSANRKKIENASSDELRSLILKLAISSANEWWEATGGKFSRLQSLLDALNSFDEKRQVRALFYLRNGHTGCEGLTREYYYEEISKEIVRLSGSDVRRIAEHAKLILLDSKLDWLSMKNN